MVLLIDLTGFLVICALCYQGYIEGLQFRPSLMVASLCSVIIFAFFFSGVYTLAMNFIPYSVVSGLLTVILLNSVCILFFYKLFSVIIAILQTRFFMPQISDRNKKIGGMIIGLCVGYIFVAGMITSFEETIVFKKRKHTQLEKSIFYKTNKQKNTPNISRKIDNIPALKYLYSQENVDFFEFTEPELLAIMKMIREISNEEAKTILEKVKSKENPSKIYLLLIEIYTSKKDISKKYFVSQQEITALRLKIQEKAQNQGITTQKSKLEGLIDKV